MTKWLAAFVRGIDTLNIWMGRVVAGFAVVVLIILLHEIVSRYFFNAPINWGTETMLFLVSGYFLLGGGYALLRGAHVRMDVLYNRWSPRGKAIADLATFPLAAIYVGVLVWIGTAHGVESIILQEHTASVWGPPTAPVKIVIFIGCGLLFLQLLVCFIRDLYVVFRRKVLE